MAISIKHMKPRFKRCRTKSASLQQKSQQHRHKTTKCWGNLEVVFLYQQNIKTFPSEGLFQYKAKATTAVKGHLSKAPKNLTNSTNLTGQTSHPWAHAWLPGFSHPLSHSQILGVPAIFLVLLVAVLWQKALSKANGEALKKETFIYFCWKTW